MRDHPLHPCFKTNSVQFSPLTGSSWGHEGWFNRDPLPVFSAAGPCEPFCHGQECPLFDVVHPAFPLQTTALPTLQGALKYCLGEAVALCNMPEPCKFVSLASCQKRFPWTYKEVDLTPHSVVPSYFHINELLTKDHPSFKTAFAGFLGWLSEEGFHCSSYCVHSRWNNGSGLSVW